MPTHELTQETADLEVGGEVAGCPACPHPWNDHDQIATRFCAATTDHQFDRGCVCAAAQARKSAGQAYVR